ncbi:hypothetical protein A359_00080 [secondary endosymbiont of Ctenarytaina eucalypti]|uniref:Uncharacterized protein n=1 Tax=secondary endosymbiont of Ctenarytaina eucalypti TaxID=1199245 RepID=J3TEV3_9ENTR|nr:hypothetical protein A359_00080 [secondary endosymbiont of Ctenarytaina eucalypti]
MKMLMYSKNLAKINKPSDYHTLDCLQDEFKKLTFNVLFL